VATPPGPVKQNGTAGPMFTRLRYVGRRLFRSVFVIIGIMLVAFFLVRLPPGDVVDFLTADQAVDPEYLTRLRQQFGLDLPLHEQFFVYARQLLSLDLGYSFRQQEPVLALIMERLPATLNLAAS